MPTVHRSFLRTTDKQLTGRIQIEPDTNGWSVVPKIRGSPQSERNRLRASSGDKVGTEKRRGKRKSGATILPRSLTRVHVFHGGGGAHHVHLYII